MGCGCSSFDGGYNNAEGQKPSKETIKKTISKLVERKSQFFVVRNVKVN